VGNPIPGEGDDLVGLCASLGLADDDRLDRLSTLLVGNPITATSAIAG
jgi:hypothetical protein